MVDLLRAHGVERRGVRRAEHVSVQRLAQLVDWRFAPGEIELGPILALGRESWTLDIPAAGVVAEAAAVGDGSVEAGYLEVGVGGGRAVTLHGDQPGGRHLGAGGAGEGGKGSQRRKGRIGTN